MKVRKYRSSITLKIMVVRYSPTASSRHHKDSLHCEHTRSLLDDMFGSPRAMAATLTQWLSDSQNPVFVGIVRSLLQWISLHKAQGLIYSLGAFAALLAMFQKVYQLLLDISGCEIQIRGDNPNAEYVMTWMRQHFNNRLGTNQTAEICVTSPSDSQRKCHQDVITGCWSFDRVHEKLYTLYDVGYGSHFFFYRSRAWMYRRRKEHSEFRHIDILSVRCIGSWSPENVQNLIEEAKRNSLKREPVVTQIFTPANRVQRQKGMEQWTCIQETRISRDVATIDLENGVKEDIISDINSFLSPGQYQHYTKKGIRYGRNLLFHGPPGTGKTALIHSLSGIFGLCIYRMSLSSPELTDDDLLILLSRVPSTCIVLFEDIDQAGLPMRRVPNDAGKITGAESYLQAFRPITLSGFLNAIDGVATPEGIIMFFTTNCLADLDSAIVRPGRVDRIVEFGNAGKSQIRSMFLRMYPPESTSKSAFEEKAQMFANKVRDRSVTPASLQEFLLRYQGAPDDAIAAVEAWQSEEPARPVDERSGIVSVENTYDDMRQGSGATEMYPFNTKER